MNPEYQGDCFSCFLFHLLLLGAPSSRRSLAYDLVRVHAASAGPPLDFGHETRDGIAFGEMLILKVTLGDSRKDGVDVADVGQDGSASPGPPTLAAHARIVVVGEARGATTGGVGCGDGGVGEPAGPGSRCDGWRGRTRGRRRRRGKDARGVFFLVLLVLALVGEEHARRWRVHDAERGREDGGDEVEAEEVFVQVGSGERRKVDLSSHERAKI